MARVTCNASLPPVAACAYDGIGIRLYGMLTDGDPGVTSFARTQARAFQTGRAPAHAAQAP
jgi:hypothetical protein